MDAALYVDELINEYLLFRGFIKTFTHFNTEKSTSAAAYAERSGGGGKKGTRLLGVRRVHTSATAGKTAKTKDEKMEIGGQKEMEACGEFRMRIRKQ